MSEETTKPIRLLIADDEEDLVTFLAHRLRKRGIREGVHCVYSTEPARTREAAERTAALGLEYDTVGTADD